MSSKKIEFKVANKTLVCVPITNEVSMGGQKAYGVALKRALDSELPLKAELERQLESKNLLDQASNQKKIDDIRHQLKMKELYLRRADVNGRRMTKEEGRAVALEMRSLRAKLNEVGQDVSSFLQNSVESFADSERLQYFIFACTRDERGDKYWHSFDDFKANVDSPEAKEATKAFLTMMTGTNADFESGYYENKWLIRQGYMNAELKFINKDGHLVDEDGRLIDKDGRFVNAAGSFVNKDGDLVDENGQLVAEDAWETVSVKTVEPLVTVSK